MARGVVSDLPTVSLFGSRLHCLTLAETCDAAEAMIGARDRCHLICVKDVGLTVRCRDDASLGAFYERSDLVVVDGEGLVLAARLLGLARLENVCGPALYGEMLRRARLRGYGVYLLGARAEVVAEVARRLRAQTPPVRVVGWRDGYFAGREAEVIADIAGARPDVLFVGISTPLREQFLGRWRDRLPPCVCIPVGGVFDVEAGLVRGAPEWVWRRGFGWLYRTLQEPRRLTGRYLRTHSRFAALLAAALVRRALGRDGTEGAR
jgi:N-acetylglucosaminyldiphosphoundecaprenol N-acetyl-beta-D-mannosaminyltransferase